MKKALLITLIILVLAAIPITLLVVKQRQEIRQRAAPATSLFFEPATIAKTAGDTNTFSLNVMINTGADNNLAYFTDLHIDYDPTYIEVVDFQNGSFFNQVLDGPTLSEGTAYISLGNDTPKSTGGTSEVLATLIVKVKDQTTPTTLIVFDRETTVDEEMTFGRASAEQDPSLGQGIDIIVAADSASVTINGAGGASPTPEPSATPGASATPGPSATPGASATPAPSPSATPSASPNQYTFITTPTNGATVTVKRPTIAGTTYPNGLVILSLSLNSSPVLSGSFYANASGNWSYVPIQDLTNGTYIVTATGSDSSNQNSETATSTFIVDVNTGGGNIATPTPAASPSPGSASPTPSVTPASGGTGTGTDTTKGGVPVTGTSLPTYTLVGLATIFLILGLGAIFLPK